MNWYGLITFYVIATGFSGFGDLLRDNPIDKIKGAVQMISAAILMSYVELWAK